MPYASEAQRRFFHANKDKLAKQGVNVSEWDEASRGKKLPERKGKTPRQKFEHQTKKRLYDVFGNEKK